MFHLKVDVKTCFKKVKLIQRSLTFLTEISCHQLRSHRDDRHLDHVARRPTGRADPITGGRGRCLFKVRGSAHRTSRHRRKQRRQRLTRRTAIATTANEICLCDASYMQRYRVSCRCFPDHFFTLH